MALLSCVRKHRTLWVYRHQQAWARQQAFRLKQASLLAASPALVLKTQASVPLTSDPHQLADQLATATQSRPKETASEPMATSEATPTPTATASTPTAEATTTPTATSAVVPTKAQPTADIPIPQATETRVGEPTAATPTTSSTTHGPESTSPWQSLVLTFLSLLHHPEPDPDAASGAHSDDVSSRSGSDDFDPLLISSVPPQQALVWTPPAPAAELRSETDPVAADVDAKLPKFWRYDMESYAANRRNEDRSQFLMDVVVRVDAQGTQTSTPLFFCGCYDGHGGEEAVEFVRQRLYAQIKQVLSTTTLSVRDAIIAGFEQTDAAFHRHSKRRFARGMWSSCSVGACAVIALIVHHKLYVAGCGDCRAILAFRKADGALTVEQITTDHSANNEDEQKRLRDLYPHEYDIVRQVGIDSFYVKGRLQPTRSLGDTYMKFADVNRAPMPRGLRIQGEFDHPYITATPDVFEVDLTNRHPEFLVLGSDGLYGELNNEEIVELVAAYRTQGASNVSKALLSSVLFRVAEDFGYSLEELEHITPGERRNYHDDITIDIVHFSPPGAMTSSSSSSCSSTTEPEAEEAMLTAT